MKTKKTTQRTQKIVVLTLLATALLLLLSSFAFAQQSHPANEITPGTFGDGDYTFQKNMTVNATLEVPTVNTTSVTFADGSVQTSASSWMKNGNDVYILNTFVGVGTNNPQYALDIGTGNSPEFVSGLDVSTLRFFDNSYQTRPVPHYRRDGSTSSNFGQIRVDNAGRVGINLGKDSLLDPWPSIGAALDVGGKIKLTGIGHGIIFPDGTKQTAAVMGGVIQGDPHSLDAADGNPVDRVFVDAEGRVGIADLTPSQALDMIGILRSTGTICTTGGKCMTDLQNPPQITLIDDGNSLDASDGNPSDAVWVNNQGTVYFSGAGINTYNERHLFFSNPPSGQFVTLGIGSAKPYAGVGAKITGNDAYLHLGTSNNYGTGITNNAIVINPENKVGIGVGTPQTQLDVAGDIKATGEICSKIGEPDTCLSNAHQFSARPGALMLRNNLNGAAASCPSGWTQHHQASGGWAFNAGWRACYKNNANCEVMELGRHIFGHGGTSNIACPTGWTQIARIPPNNNNIGGSDVLIQLFCLRCN